MLILTLLLLYGGLNLVEGNMLDLMGLEREAAVFSFKRPGSGLLELTFSGTRVTFSLDKLQAVIESWREWFSLTD